MKKLLTGVLAAALMLLGTQAHAQLSVGAGYKMLQNKTEKTNASLNGAYAGADYTIPLVGGLSITPGAYVTFVTGENSGSLFGIASGSATVNELYLSVPVHVSYGINLSNDIRGFVFAGPSLDYGLSSKTKYEGSAVGVSAEKTVNNYDNDAYNPLDVKVGGGVGLDILGVTRVKIGYDCGLLNRGTEKVALHTNQLYAGVSLLF